MASIRLASFLALGLALLSIGCASRFEAPAARSMSFGFVVHGGAGVPPREQMTSEKRAALEQSLRSACEVGKKILAAGGTALDAVTAAVVLLEDDPQFNAGKGAVLTHDKKCELDASIVEGHTRRAGAVAALEHVKNPIKLARAVMEKSEHVMLIGAGAEVFALEQGLEFVPNEYFETEFRREQLEAKLREEQASSRAGAPSDKPYGTVGAVARDAHGQLAAATSTGGMTNKRFGRVGDSPILGAGTYADSRVAISATGWGEFFIRLGVAHDVAARIGYGGADLQSAAQSSIAAVGALGGYGVLIAIDRDGNIAMPFNSDGMYRAWLDEHGEVQVEIY